jgi:cob(I)alamin adenosyltransferase
MRGYIQVYTGDGKGKTTAALGLALRACGAGLRVYIGQFLKKGRFSEVRAIARGLPGVKLEQYGRGPFVRGKPSPADVQAAATGLKKLAKALSGGAYDLVIADEINPAVAIGLLPASEVVRLMDGKPPRVELVLTGRGAAPPVIRKADVVTEMKCVKHYFDRGVGPRRGIEL